MLCTDVTFVIVIDVYIMRILECWFLIYLQE